MDILTTALKSRVPLIHVETTDLVHIKRVLSALAGTEAKPLPDLGLIKDAEVLKQKEGEVFFTGHDEPPEPKLWTVFRQANKTLVYVNTKPSVLQLDGGTMFPPKELVLEFLKGVIGDPENAESILHCFGGMTLKDIFEVVKMAAKEFGQPVVSKSLNAIRQSMISSTKGLNQVDTDQVYYDAPKALTTWMNDNFSFFKDFKFPELAPRGLLLDGPPGTGKSAAAKYIANHAGMPLYHVALGNMKGKYVGDSEGSLRDALRQIDMMAPCVVLLDEVEKVLKGHNSDTSGVTSSMLSQLLWWLQEHKTQVFTLMTTNDMKAIAPELYRPGRIDATLTFNGLESPQAMAMFIDKLLQAKLIKAFPDKQVITLPAWVATSIKTFIMGQGDAALPQAKAETFVLELVKKMIVAEYAAAQSAPAPASEVTPIQADLPKAA